MKTIDIEFYDIQKTGNGYVAEYVLNGEDKTPFIKTTELIDFIIEMELNWLYVDAPDDLTEVDAYSYLEDNYDDVVKQFVTQGL